MSDLIYQTSTKKCQGWTNPSSSFYTPIINSLSGYYSPAGSTTLVSINGSNFYSYSSVCFGGFKPTVYFINSNILQFYIPSTLNSGIYSVQVFNGSIYSNIITYNIDNSSGYWLLNSNGNISNTNNTTTNNYTPALVSISSLSRGAPVTVNVTDSEYTVPNNVTWIICNNNNTTTIDLPSGTGFVGREITIKKTVDNATISSTTSNIIPFDETSTSNTILVYPYNWVTLVCNSDSNWHIMQRGQ